MLPHPSHAHNTHPNNVCICVYVFIYVCVCEVAYVCACVRARMCACLCVCLISVVCSVCGQPSQAVPQAPERIAQVHTLPPLNISMGISSSNINSIADGSGCNRNDRKGCRG